MILLFALMVLIEVKTPNRFKWEEKTYGHFDANPFGAKVVDSLLASSVKNGYEVRPGSLKDAYDDNDSTSTVLLVDYRFNDYENEYMYDEVDMLEIMLNRGQTVIIFTDMDLGYDMVQCFNIMIEPCILNYHHSKNNMANPDSIQFKWKDDSCYDDAEYKFRTFDSNYSIILSGNSTNSYNSYDPNDSIYYTDWGYDDEGYDDEGYDEFQWEGLLTTGYYDNEWVVATCNYADSKLVLVSYPQLFTNYYVLEHGGAQLLMRILSQAGDKPIVRYDRTINDKFISEENQSQSLLRVFVDHKSLRWAVYLALLGVVISLFFTARRKQRVIPVVEKPKNQTIEMIKHIGLLYYRNHDNISLVSNKYRQLVFELQRQRLIYLDEELDDDSMQTLADLAELDTEKLNMLLTRIKAIDDDDFDVKVRDKEAKRLIDVMNKMLNNL